MPSFFRGFPLLDRAAPDVSSYPQQGPPPSFLGGSKVAPPARLATQSCRAHWKCQGMNTPSLPSSRRHRYINAPAPLQPPCPGSLTGSQGAAEGWRPCHPPRPHACSHALYWLPSLPQAHSLLSPACVCWSTSQTDYLPSNPCPGRGPAS